jgi:hypothetical protein
LPAPFTLGWSNNNRREIPWNPEPEYTIKESEFSDLYLKEVCPRGKITSLFCCQSPCCCQVCPPDLQLCKHNRSSARKTRNPEDILTSKEIQCNPEHRFQFFFLVFLHPITGIRQCCFCLCCDLRSVWWRFIGRPRRRFRVVLSTT